MIRRLAVAACIALASTVPAWAAPLISQTDDPARRAAIDGAHRQLAICAAYFQIIAEAVPPTGRPMRPEAAGDALVGQMLRLRDVGVTRARIEAERRFLGLVMGGSVTFYPRLREAFGESCEAIAADPQGHVERWLAGAPPTGR